jgi:hypothetical protein
VLIDPARELFYRVDPRGGSLFLRSEGGPGGDGLPPGTSGFTGSGGWQSSSGWAGEPGRIVMHVDSRALPYLDHFDIAGEGRTPGRGPQVIIEPVAPWW